MSADKRSNVVAFSRISGKQPGAPRPRTGGVLSAVQKDCRAAMAHIDEAVELLQREVDNLVERLSAQPDAEESDPALKRLEEVRAQLDATRLRTQRGSE